MFRGLSGLIGVWLLGSCAYITDKEHNDRIDQLTGPLEMSIQSVTPTRISECQDRATLQVQGSVDGSWADTTFEVLYAWDGVNFENTGVETTSDKKPFNGRASLSATIEVVPQTGGCDTGEPCPQTLSVGLLAPDGTQASADWTDFEVVPLSVPALVDAGLADDLGNFTAFGDVVVEPTNPTNSVQRSDATQVAVALSDALLASGLDGSARFEVVACPGQFDPQQDDTGCVYVSAEEAPTVQIGGRHELIVAADSTDFADAACAAGPSVDWSYHLHIVDHPCVDEAWIDLGNTPFRLVKEDCDGDGERVSEGDCNDDDATVNTTVTDVPYDGIDADCAGDLTWETDVDQDGAQCDSSHGGICAGTDCDDANGAIRPGLAEVCDANDWDEDCSGTADDADLSATGQTDWYADVDGDGYGDSSDVVSACDAPSGYVADDTDCDDGLSTVNPGETEAAGNEVDEDCDNSIDCYQDADGDGFGGTAATVVADDGDGFCLSAQNESTSTDDCNDADAGISPAAQEICDPNDVDEDCDGQADDADDDAEGAFDFYADVDNDSYGDKFDAITACEPISGRVLDGTDCDDSLATGANVHPGQTDTCNGVDDDCSGYTDDGGDCGCESRTNDGHTYLFCPATDWTSARTDCQSNGYDLVTIDDDAEGNWLYTNNGGYFWTGLNDRATEGTFEWADGTPLSYTLWDTPPTADPARNCVLAAINPNTEWWAQNCDEGYRYVCETCAGTFYADADGDGDGDPARPLASCTPPAGYVANDDDCDDSDATNQCACRTVVGPDGNYAFCFDPLPWAQAATSCTTLGGRLVTLDDEAEDTFVATTAATLEGGGWFIAYNDRTTEGQFEWDGGGGDWENFAFDAPNDWYGAEDCVAVNHSNEPGWHDVSCGLSLPYVCEPCPDWYTDSDGDGLGDPATAVNSCTRPNGAAVLNDRDCDDTNPSITDTWYRDLDGDGFGDVTDFVSGTCTQPSGYIPQGNDCFDGSPNGSLARPGGTEVCDGLDNDCNGFVDDGGVCTGCTVATQFGSTYRYCDTGRDWVDARTDCQNAGYDFVSISSEDEDVWVILQALWINSSDTWFLGFTDNAVEGQWAWDDGSAVVYEHWDSGEPGPDNCAVVDPANGYWSSVACPQNHAYICETGIGTSYADTDGDGYGDPAAPWSGETVRPGYVDNAQDCDDTDASAHPASGTCGCTDIQRSGTDYALCQTPMDWDDASADCRGRNMRLVSFESDAENDAVIAAADAIDLGSWWIGYSDASGAWTWDGGSESAYENWAANQPANFGGYEDCASTGFSAGAGWFDRHCGLQMPYICEQCPTWYLDGDGDGYGTDTGAAVSCDRPSASHVQVGGDCNDADGSVNPGVPVYADLDGDGYGDPFNPSNICDEPTWTTDTQDCDDGLISAHPLGTETCNGHDDDCDGSVDEAACGSCTVFSVNGHNYMACPSTLDWTSAEGACQNDGYELATLDTLEEHAAIAQWLNESSLTSTRWVGLVDPEGDQTFVWTDGSTGYQSWSSPPSNTGSACGYLETQGAAALHDDACTNAHRPLCESDCGVWFRDADGDGFGDTNDATTHCGQPAGYAPVGFDCDDADALAYPGSGSCPCTAVNDGVQDYDYCITQSTWTEARDDCEARGTQLVTIDSDVERDWVYANRPWSNDYWIGLNDQNVEGTFEWDSGEPVTFSSWSPAQPNNTNNEDCVIGLEGSPSWSDTSCDGRHAYVCEPCPTWYDDADGDGFGNPATAQVACEQPPGTVLNGDDCGSDPNVNPNGTEACNGLDDDCDGFVDEGAVCGDCTVVPRASGTYLMCDGPASTDWDSARADCQARGYDLVVVDDSAEDSLVEDLRGVFGQTSTWIGYSDPDYDGFFQWVDGGSPSYENWASAEPSATGGPTTCTSSRIDGWHTHACTDTRSYVCETCERTWYRDSDGDTFGDVDDRLSACTQPPGYVPDAGDCDDNDSGTHPGLGNCACVGGSHDGGAYLFCDNARSWVASRTDCETRGYHLVVVHDPAESLYIARAGTLALAEPPGWIGLNDGAVEGTFVWVDGSALDYQPAGAIFDDSPAPADCVFTTSLGTWDDTQCASGQNYVCEARCGLWYADGDGDGYGDPSTAVDQCGRPPGYVEDGTDCDDADASVNPAVIRYADADGDTYGDRFVTADACSAPATYVADDTDCLDSDASVNTAGSETCNGLDDDCSGGVDDGVCTDCAGFDALGSAYLACTTPLDWSAARADCQSRGYDLATIDSLDEHSALTDFGGAGGTFHIGLHDQNAEGIYEWADGSTSTFTKWGAADPDGGSAENCVQISTDGGGAWGDRPCSEARSYFCESPCGTVYLDADGDGFGDSLSATSACGASPGWVPNSEDCDDADATAYPGSGTCPCATTSDGFQDYTLCSDLVDWDTAQADCRARGQRLVVLDDAAEHAFLDAAEGFSSRWWTGYTDAATEGTWVWESGDTFTYAPWGTSQPNDFNDQDCATGINNTATISDEACHEHRPYICESCWTWYDDLDGDGHGDPASGRQTCDRPPTGTLDGTDCDDGDGTRNPSTPETCNGIDDDCDGRVDEAGCDASCARLDHAGRSYLACTNPENWPNARASCQGQGYDLAIVEDATEQAWVASLQSAALDGIGFYIGLSDQAAEGQFAWVDGSTPVYTAWAGANPDGGDPDDCVFQAGTGWLDGACGNTRPYLCETCNSSWYLDDDGDGYGDPDVPTSSCGQPPGYVDNADDCNDGDAGVYLGNGCTCSTVHAGDSRFLVCSDIATFDGAAAACQARGGTLASLPGPEARTVGEAVAARTIDAWIGYTDRAVEGVFQWTDGTPPGSEHWAVGSPDGGTAQNCVVSSVGNGQWADQDCTTSRGYVCELACGTWYLDGDGDGHGDPSDAIEQCGQPAGRVADGTDCDDAAAAIHPDAAEVCDGIDNDCDGGADDGDPDGAPEVWGDDADADGFGDPLTTAQTCSPPGGYVLDTTDCDDGDFDTKPTGVEICDGVDNDCDGQADETGCGGGCAAFGWGGHNYLMCTTPTDWTTAEASCAANGYDLVSYEDAAENDAIDAEGLTRNVPNWWIGYTDAALEDTWVWESGAPVTYENWAPTDPNGSPTLNCAYQGTDGLWGDEDCTTARPYVCESCAGSWWPDQDGDGYGDPGGPVVSSCSAPGAGYVDNDTDCDDTDVAAYPGAGTCACTTDSFDGHGYTVCEYRLDWAAARDDCLARGQALATIEDSAETAWVGGQVPDVAWIGGNDLDTETVFVWDSGRPFAYQNWHGVQPDDSLLDGEDCVAAMPGGLWRDESCLSTRPFVCEDCPSWYADADGDGFGDAGVGSTFCTDPGGGWGLDSSDCNDADVNIHPNGTEACNGADDDCNGVVDDPGACGPDCVQATHAGHNYRLCNLSSNWDDARAECQAVGYDLVVVDDQDEQDLVAGWQRALNATLWIGLSDQATEGTYEWIDGSPYGFEAWATNEPAAQFAADDCIRQSTTGWYDINCGSDSAYLCETCEGTWFRDRDGDGYGDATLPTASCGQPAGYVDNPDDCDDADGTVNPGAANCGGCVVRTYNGKAYTFCTGASDWATARADCQAKGGELASLADNLEAIVVGAYSVQLIGNNAWIGLNDQATEGVYLWSDGTPPNAENWGFGEPDDSPTDNCVLVNTTADWADANCTIGYGHICELTCGAWYPDSDGDGYGTGDPITQCGQPPGYAAAAGDCNDSDANINPGAPERCDPADVDEDCDGGADEFDPDGAPEFWFSDGDGDTFGDPLTWQQTCSPPGGWVMNDGDCDDIAGTVNPNASEVCDGVDNDCNGVTDEQGCPGDCSPASFGGSAYLFCTSPAIWTTARDNCLGMGFDLVTIEDFDENDDMDAYGAGLGAIQWWIGLTDAATENTWVWQSGDPSAFRNWGPTDPNGSTAANCAFQGVDGLWGDAGCSATYAYVCEACGSWWPDLDRDGFGDPSGQTVNSCTDPGPDYVGNADDCDDTNAAAFPGSGQCPCRTASFNGSTYTLCDVPTDWSTAEAACTARGEALAAVTDGDEAALLAGELPSPAWLGATDQFSEGSYTWGSGEPWAYENWAATQPDDAVEGQDCLVAQPDGTWDDLDCRLQRPYVCESCPTWFVDVDGDGFGLSGNTITSCTDPGVGYALQPGDCNDGNGGINPGAGEVCDPGNVDEDCDGLADDADLQGASGLLTWHPDADVDGFGDGFTSVDACDAPANHLADGTDCDDDNPNARPGFTESCNGFDDDCDGAVDDGGVCASNNCDTVSVGGQTYLFCNDTIDQVTASAACAGLGDYSLVTVDDAIENDALLFEVKSRNNDYWMGLTDVVDGTYLWEDGSPAVFTAWADSLSEPNGGAASACATLTPWGWRDVPCSTTVRYVCESHCGTVYPDTDGDGQGDPAGPSASSCLSQVGWAENDWDCNDNDPAQYIGSGTCPSCYTQVYDGVSYDICDSYTATWDQARQDCAARGKTLAIIDDAGEDAFLSGALGPSTWLGLTDLASEGDWAWEVSGTTATYTNWAAGEPIGDARFNCASMEPIGFWASAGCETPKSWVCEDCPVWYEDVDGDGWGNPLVTMTSCAPVPGYVLRAGDCIDTDVTVNAGAIETCNGFDMDCSGFVDDSAVCEPQCVQHTWGGSAYLLCDGPLDWSAAAGECATRNHDLVTFDDQAEHDALLDAFYAHMPAANVWTGLTDEGSEGVYYWHSGSGSTYTNWAVGAPNDVSGTENCAMSMGAIGGAWDDVSCSATAPYICETCWGTLWYDNDGDGYGDPAMPVSTCASPGAVPNAGDLDDDDFGVTTASCTTETFGSSVYRFCDDVETWAQADARCTTMGGTLVTIDDVSEDRWLSGLAQQLEPGVPWWTGYTDRATEGDYDWADGTLDGYENWAALEPSAETVDVDCATLFGGTWDARDCTTTFRSICEIR